jgi:hypothetical protein
MRDLSCFMLYTISSPGNRMKMRGSCEPLSFVPLHLTPSDCMSRTLGLYKEDEGVPSSLYTHTSILIAIDRCTIVTSDGEPRWPFLKMSYVVELPP